MAPTIFDGNLQLANDMQAVLEDGASPVARAWIDRAWDILRRMHRLCKSAPGLSSDHVIDGLRAELGWHIGAFQLLGPLAIEQEACAAFFPPLHMMLGITLDAARGADESLAPGPAACAPALESGVFLVGDSGLILKATETVLEQCGSQWVHLPRLINWPGEAPVWPGLVDGLIWGADGPRLLRELRARPPFEGEITIVVWCLNELVDGDDLLDDILEGLWHTVDMLIRHLAARGSCMAIVGGKVP